MKNLSKIFIIIVIIAIIVTLCIFFINKNNVTTEVQKRVEGYENLDESKYPGYKEKISAIQKEHPNWSFTVLYTGLNWEDVILNESEGNHSINLVDGSDERIGSGEWLCQTCGEKIYQEPSWKCASKLGVAYQMDPRNFLNSENIFQFETLSYVKDMYTIEGVEKILENSYMHNITIKDFYKEIIPNNNFSNKKFSEVIMETAKKVKVSPYHLAIRIVQGNIAMAGDAKTPMDAVKGNIEGFEGLFNYFNIGSKISGDNARDRGLFKAKEENWTTPEKSIEAGANYITENYIKLGQDTLYLQKFDVINNKLDGLYKHQYMQNLHGAVTEGNKTYNIYNNGMLTSAFNFIIPVYENMPKETRIPNSNNEKTAGIDYLVLVNKQNQLPDDWEEKVQLVTVKDAWGDDIKVEKQAYEKYKELKTVLEKEQVYIELDSCYRSVTAQQELWDRWTVEKGIDYVKTYVAVPGYSEHHTGLALDICIKVNGELVYKNEDMIAQRETFAKIHAKLAEYGFILRYLENRDDITGYAYEPWHLRYVGSTEIAKEIMTKDITFEEYLGSIKNIKETPSAAKYQIQKTLENYLKEVYDNKIKNVRFNIKKVYSDEEAKNNQEISSLKLGKNDIPFKVQYQLQPADGIDANELIIVDGVYDENLGWVKDINRLGILKYNETNGSYSIENFGTGW